MNNTVHTCPLCKGKGNLKQSISFSQMEMTKKRWLAGMLKKKGFIHIGEKGIISNISK